MKKPFYLYFIVFIIIACGRDIKKDYAYFSGKLINDNVESFIIYSKNADFKKKIKINKDGTFNDSIKINQNNLFSFSVIYDSTATSGSLYLKKGYDLNIGINTDRPAETAVSFSGVGSEANTFLLKQKEHKLSPFSIYLEFYRLKDSSKAEFSKNIEKLYNKKATMLEELINTTPGLSKEFKILQREDLKYAFLNAKAVLSRGPQFISSTFPLPVDIDSVKLNNDYLYLNSTSYNKLCDFILTQRLQNKTIKNDVTVNFLDSLLTSIKIKPLQTKWINKVKYTLLNDNKSAKAKSYLDVFINHEAIDEDTKNELKTFYTNTIKLKIGNVSPKFFDYVNHDGGTTSLDDFKGRYVYIDIWATWCPPCRAEIPFLKEVEKKYHDKNIVFVSISVDKKSDYDKWRKMVVEQELTGVQLFADNARESDFVQAYTANTIPRFLLIDPDGNTLSTDAPRPSDPKLIELFDSLDI